METLPDYYAKIDSPEFEGITRDDVLALLPHLDSATRTIMPRPESVWLFASANRSIIRTIPPRERFSGYLG